MLEQYEAQIISAMAPGFEVDASPEITSAGCQICAYFLGSGIVQDIALNSRPIKFLSSLLDQFARNEQKTCGRTPNAQMVVKLAILSAWAKLYLSIQNPTKRSDVFGLYLPQLGHLWVEVLKDYAMVGDDAESSRAEQGFNNSLYGTATRDFTLPYFQESWSCIMCASAELIVSKPDLVPDQPGLFFTLYGLCFEYLCNPFKIQDIDNTIRSVEKLLSTPNFALVNSVRQTNQNVFLELLEILDKISQTESISVQSSILSLLTNILHNNRDKLYSESFKSAGYKIAKITFTISANQIPELSNFPSSNLSKASISKVEESKLLLKAVEFVLSLSDPSGITDSHLAELIPITLSLISGNSY